MMMIIIIFSLLGTRVGSCRPIRWCGKPYIKYSNINNVTTVQLNYHVM